MSETSPAALLQRAQAGDGSALGELLTAYRHYLSFLAGIQIHRRLPGKADASDLVQETCLEVHRSFKQFRGQSEAEFAAWLRTILASRVANHLRRYLDTKQRDAHLERGLMVELDDCSSILDRGLLAPDHSPSQQAMLRESARLLADALQRLPADYRQVVVLRHFDGLSFTEVAERMGRSVDSIQKLWVRALTRLRQEFPTGQL